MARFEITIKLESQEDLTKEQEDALKVYSEKVVKAAQKEMFRIDGLVMSLKSGLVEELGSAPLSKEEEKAFQELVDEDELLETSDGSENVTLTGDPLPIIPPPAVLANAKQDVIHEKPKVKRKTKAKKAKKVEKEKVVAPSLND